jgi:hypothetical protein
MAVINTIHGCTSSETAEWGTTGQSATQRMSADAPRDHQDHGVLTDGTDMPVTAEQDIALEALEPEMRSQAVRDTSIDLLLQASRSENPLLRANALEALQHAPQVAEAVVRRGLVDDNRGVRFVAAMTIGRLNMKHLSHLLEPLLEDESESVRAAAMFGMKQCGYNVDLNPLATFLSTGDAEVKANAALVLGEIGDPSAIPLLRSALGKGLQMASPIRARIVDLQIAEAIVKLGDLSQIEGIRAALFSPVEQGELTALAALICGRVHDEGSLPTLLDLATTKGDRRQPPEIRLAATMAIAQIDPNRAPIDVPLSFIKSASPELRSQAALTLGYIGGPEAEESAYSLLSDDNPLVQLASAGAILNMQDGAGKIAVYDPALGTGGSVDTNNPPRYKKELSQVSGDRR